MTTIVSTIITAIITLICCGLTLVGVIYQSNKTYDRQQAQAEARQQLLEQQFKDYQDLIHLSNKDIKEDIQKLSKRVDEHNNYGIKIPVIEKELESVQRRLSNLEDR